jgi:ATP-dependent helicase/nuclease subunit A
MNKAPVSLQAPDHAQRIKALNLAHSILVQAPAGSGKTDLLTRRFLRLLAEVEDPGQIVAITFTIAAAAEMRHRILAELEKAAATIAPTAALDPFSMEALAARALERSRLLGWQLPDLSAQLRILTIDSFCRELALQQPLLSGLGSDLGISEQPTELYRRAARRTLEQIDGTSPALTTAIVSLLSWRDNNWGEVEEQLVEMLSRRDRWMHDFVLVQERDWDALREQLERPFLNAVRGAVNELDSLLNQVPIARNESLLLARFACAQSGDAQFRDLAEIAEFPSAPFETADDLNEAHSALVCLANLLLTKEGTFRSRIDKTFGFPADHKVEKARLAYLIQSFRLVEGLESALAKIRTLPPPRYEEEDWQIIRSCFTLLRQAVIQLQVVFAEAGTVDFTEVAQIAQRVLRDEDGLPSDAAIVISDRIHHLLVDEFQDTSRRQYKLLASLAAAWPDRTGRTIFAVGDPLQSIYFFRDADAELFPRVRQYGLEIPDADPLSFEPADLAANFRTAPPLVSQLNEVFQEVFSVNNGSELTYHKAKPARADLQSRADRFALHLKFVPRAGRGRARNPEDKQARATAHAAQVEQIVALIRGKQGLIRQVQQAREQGENAKYRIAVLGRAKKSLAPIAAGLREAGIAFRAVELEQLRNRPEVKDAITLGRALLNAQDRVAWLGVLRGPWCGLALNDLHTLTSADDPQVLDRPIPELLSERIHLLDPATRHSVERVLRATANAFDLRALSPTSTLGTWLEQVWLSLGGAACVDSTARANLNLLWTCLDNLRNAEQDFLSPVLDSALEKLTALPDPGASSEFGVQLMTIHKSKGLEFEVVIVPDLQARGAITRSRMLSWLERGLTDPDHSQEVTEFLVAPMQSKGADRGSAKQWVDRVYRERETQEMRRILYVALTRAREELHLFARPEYKTDAGSPVLAEPTNSLLATAWPALKQAAQAQFDQWTLDHESSKQVEEPIVQLAAEGDGNQIVLEPAPRPTRIRRLPAAFDIVSLQIGASSDSKNQIGLGDRALYSRHEGGVSSRALGNAVHLLLEQAARLRATGDWATVRSALAELLPRISAKVRAAGAEPSTADRLTAKALEIAIQSISDPHGQWILSPHTEAANEVAWTGVAGSSLRSVRVDRIFRAGRNPLSEDNTSWWIVDYKTTHAEGLDVVSAIPELRRLFAPQLEAYAVFLRNLHSPNLQDADLPIRAGLYYPRMALFDWWVIQD